MGIIHELRLAHGDDEPVDAAPPFGTADSLVGRLADCQSAASTSRHARRPQVGNLRYRRPAVCTTHRRLPT